MALSFNRELFGKANKRQNNFARGRLAGQAASLVGNALVSAYQTRQRQQQQRAEADQTRQANEALLRSSGYEDEDVSAMSGYDPQVVRSIAGQRAQDARHRESLAQREAEAGAAQDRFDATQEASVEAKKAALMADALKQAAANQRARREEEERRRGLIETPSGHLVNPSAIPQDQRAAQLGLPTTSTDVPPNEYWAGVDQLARIANPEAPLGLGRIFPPEQAPSVLGLLKRTGQTDETSDSALATIRKQLVGERAGYAGAVTPERKMELDRQIQMIDERLGLTGPAAGGGDPLDDMIDKVMREEAARYGLGG